MKKLLVFLFITLSSSLVTFCNAQYSTLYDFSNTGLDPNSPIPKGLTASVTGDTLFGTTYAGGKYNNGSVFYITANGNVYDTLLSLDGTDEGENVDGGLVLSGNILYGTAYQGGKYGQGLIFSIHTDGTHFDTLHNFGWGTEDGGYPVGTLTLSSAGVLYGTTQHGGQRSDGIIFRINTDGSNYDTLHNFGINHDGTYPDASLLLSGNVLYGTTPSGGKKFGDGLIFSIHTDGTAYDTLHFFGWFDNRMDGEEPNGSLLLVGNTLYGLASAGGKYNNGSAFSIHTDGTGYDTLHSFGWGSDDGLFPGGSFTMVDSVLYSTTNEGGQFSSWGLMFSIHPDGSHYDTLHNFGNGTDGYSPVGDLIFANGVLFGINNSGGAASKGTIFSYHPLISTASVTKNTCHGESNGNATADVTGGTSPYTYSWSNGSTAAAATTNPTGTVLSAGTYTVTVTDNADNSVTASVTITQLPAIIISPSLTAATGTNNGTASATVSGGASPYTYSWAPVSASTSSVSSLSAGSYTCTVTDANGCENSSIFDITGTDAGINEVNGKGEEVKVYPNPSNGQFTIQLAVGSGQLAVVEVYNVLGEEVLTETLRSSQGDNTLNMSNQPQGIYLYRVITNNGELIGEGKIIVQR